MAKIEVIRLYRVTFDLQFFFLALENFDIRLFGSGTDGVGAVEIYISAVRDWVAICTDDDTWNDNVASILCRQLGYESGFTIIFQ